MRCCNRRGWLRRGCMDATAMVPIKNPSANCWCPTMGLQPLFISGRHRSSCTLAGRRSTSDGKKTMYVTGRDLGLDGHLAPPRSSSALPRLACAALRTTDVDLNRDTCKSWMAGIKPPTDHRHLVKGHAVLDGSELRVYPTGHRFAGTILVPMFRPDPMGRPDTLELCGVQHLMPKVAFNTDKIMAKGSHTGGAFVPFPGPDSLMKQWPAMPWRQYKRGWRLLTKETTCDL
jgi:hypothetical protein